MCRSQWAERRISRLDGVALDAAAAAFTTKSINPSRVQSRIFYDNIIDVKMRGASDSLAADLRMQLTDKLDAVGLNGQAAVANVSPALVGVISALPNPTNPGAVGVWTDFLDAYDDAVDGKNRYGRRRNPNVGKRPIPGNTPVGCRLRPPATYSGIVCRLAGSGYRPICRRRPPRARMQTWQPPWPTLPGRAVDSRKQFGVVSGWCGTSTPIPARIKPA